MNPIFISQKFPPKTKKKKKNPDTSRTYKIRFLIREHLKPVVSGSGHPVLVSSAFSLPLTHSFKTHKSVSYIKLALFFSELDTFSLYSHSALSFLSLSHIISTAFIIMIHIHKLEQFFIIVTDGTRFLQEKLLWCRKCAFRNAWR